MIYICDTSCVCMDAKIPEMENKIYFPRLHSENGKMVFYSLETSRFHTFNGRNVEQNLTDLFGTKRTVYAHAWIEPTWSQLACHHYFQLFDNIIIIIIIITIIIIIIIIIIRVN